SRWRVFGFLLSFFVNMHDPVEAPASGPPIPTQPVGTMTRSTAPVLGVLVALSFSHLVNDTLQSLIPAIYPILKSALRLDFRHIGLITLTNQLTASILQPFVGLYADRRPQPFALALGMTFTLVGLVLLSLATSLGWVLLAVAFVGIGSSVFHPEASRVAHLSSGGQPGFAQSLFQVGGNAGSSLGPLLAALIVVARGQSAIIWFSLLALLGIVVLVAVGRWYGRTLSRRKTSGPSDRHSELHFAPVSSGRRNLSLAILITLVFSKYFYLASMASYYTFFLMEKFGVPIKNAQLHLFVFLFAIAGGTFLGGPIGDRFGRKLVIWVSILGVTPFALALPYANLLWVGILSAIIGLILSSAFSAILVYAQELVPGKVGLMAGLFFGLAFGMGGIGSAVLGLLADRYGIPFVFHICSYLPLIGLLTAFLPNLEKSKKPLSVAS
ncbi:MAG: major facilitator superfamily 1, partial [Spartobacteria bacterium]|nr:major facilitator superfamily 1 [Spartobacteria bacterium]